MLVVIVAQESIMKKTSVGGMDTIKAVVLLLLTLYACSLVLDVFLNRFTIERTRRIP